MDKIQWLQPLPKDQPSFHGWLFAHTVKYGWNYEKLHAYLVDAALKETGKDMFTAKVDDILLLLEQGKIAIPSTAEVTYGLG
jgi:hypothetical protein